MELLVPLESTEAMWAPDNRDGQNLEGGKRGAEERRCRFE